MNRIFEMLKKYMIFIAILTGISIVLSLSYSNFIVASENHKVAEMYIGTLKYSMTIDGSTTNTLSVPSGETIIDVTITNENPIDTYYKLIYQNNSNISIKYHESTKDTNDNVTNYSSPNSKITSKNTNTIKLKIVNNSTSSQNITFKIIGGFATNTLNDVTVPTGYTIIEKDTSTNTYFCTTTDTLTQGLKYVNGQYTYAYKQEGKFVSSGLAWNNISKNGWGVQLTDKTSTDAVTSKVCTYINNKPITSMAYMFRNSQATTLDVSSLNTSKVTNMGSMFKDSKATTLDVSNFDTSKVTNMSFMFSVSQATTLDVSKFDTSKVTNMSYMFSDSQATTLDVSNFDTSKVTNMSDMFFNSQATTLDVSNFDTSKVTNMYMMFSDSQATTLDVSNFNTSNVTDMSYMFSYSQATVLDVSNFDTSNVTNMCGMFSSSQVTTLDLSSFNTSRVTNMKGMFNDSTLLTTIYASDKFNTYNVMYSTDMFTGCTNLVGGAGTKYNSSYINKTYARIDDGTNSPGYFTESVAAPYSFETDSWTTIAKAVKDNNISDYNIGDTKEIDMGIYGTHTVRIANMSTPDECKAEGFSQSACGFVLEFADIITTHAMNSDNTNTGGWPGSEMYSFINSDIYNALPDDLRTAIIETKVVSGHGTEASENYISTDKLYLLTGTEVLSDDDGMSLVETISNETRKLDYYSEYSPNDAKKSFNGTSSPWWLRSGIYWNTMQPFLFVTGEGHFSMDFDTLTNNTLGVSPAFRIG